MIRPVLPKLDYPVVRALAKLNHVPEEDWVFNNAGEVMIVQVRCEECAQDWPCATRLALDEYGED